MGPQIATFAIASAEALSVIDPHQCSTNAIGENSGCRALSERSVECNGLAVEDAMELHSAAVIDASVEAATKAGDFWRGQDKVVQVMQSFAIGWFQRRHAGTQAALESAQRMCTAKTPFDSALEFQAWAAGSLQRLAQDAVALQRELLDIGEAVIDASHHNTAA